MSGKARLSLRHKTLENVKRSNLSQTDKNCIQEVFKRYEDKWIKLEDQKPTQSGSYLITTKNGAVCTAHWYENSNKFSSPAGKNAEYWMPLPEGR